MAIDDLKARIARLPEQPGVYLFLNGSGETIYAGKARVLRDRVRSYLGAAGNDPKTDALLDEVAGLEFIITDSVVEALALENRLIKQRSPRYNILLRDDKTYPYLQLTTTERFPRVLVARRVERDGSVYAGPFMPASLARRTMSLTHRLFGIRSCNEQIDGRRGRACLEYDIGRCVAPCVASLCSEEDYSGAVGRARLFLEGRNDDLIAALRDRMRQAADAERFEQAAELRDAIRTVETLRDRQQKMDTVRLGDRDAFGVKAGPAGAVVQVFQMRGGRVVERMELVTEGPGAPATEPEVVEAALQQCYEDRVAPPEVHLPLDVDDRAAIETWLGERSGRRVRLIVPRRGDKRALLDLASRNAEAAYQARFNERTAAFYDALETLRTVLALPALPRRIECFDISTLQGRETVGSMVVCEDGRMRPAEYRKFRVRGRGADPFDADRAAATLGLEPPPAAPGETPAGGAVEPRPVHDDVRSMREVVFRRYRRALEQGGPFPDLVLVDGGPTQLESAYEALGNLGLANLIVAGIAKREELLYLRDRAEPIALARESPALLLVQRIRDEAHRFAVTFHRKARARRDLRSELDDVPGIGPGRRRTLLTRFGSVAGVRRATREELAAAVGARAADAVLAYFAAR